MLCMRIVASVRGVCGGRKATNMTDIQLRPCPPILEGHFYKITKLDTLKRLKYKITDNYYEDLSYRVYNHL